MSVEVPALNINTSVLETFYESLAERFDNSTSASGFSNLVEAINEIAIAEGTACSSSELLDVSQLASDFASAFSQNLTDESLREIRIILGEILCAESMEQDSLSDVECPLRGNCTCSPGEISSNIICTCEFFACLDVEDHLGPIFGFSSLAAQGRCLAFIIDTTGSMADEIAAITTVITEFLRSEETINELRCYVLVPFNDRGNEANSKQHHTYNYYSLQTSWVQNFVISI